MLEIVKPLAVVSCTINMDVNALAIGFVVNPVALVNVSVDVREFAETVGTVVLPVALVARAIWPNLLTLAVTESTNPLARVLGSRLVDVGGSRLPLRVGIVGRIADRFALFQRREVTTVSALGLLEDRDLLPC